MAANFLRSHGIDLQDIMTQAQFDESSTSPPKGGKSDNAKSIPLPIPNPPTFSSQPLTEIRGVKLATGSPNTTWDLLLENGHIKSKTLHIPAPNPSTSSIHDVKTLHCPTHFLALSLCHPHIHLDKPFLLSHPKYTDLQPTTGSFPEALSLTSRAKSRFETPDLLQRGRWLIEESLAAGVTCMRAFVEIDPVVGFKCLEAGLRLKAAFAELCEIQLCAFAQDAVFSGEKEEGEEGRRLMEEAIRRVDVLGSTPYVESDERRMRANVDWAIATALRYGKHLDLHLDYNLDPRMPPLVHYVVDALHAAQWNRNSGGKKIVLGHCTRLTLFSEREWRDLRTRIADLPISFVGLPTSDLFIGGKPNDSEGGGERPRGTLQIPQMIEKYGFQCAIGVNNVGNAFTPQGSCDPLSIASMGVGIYHAGTKKDSQMLYECVSTRAREAIGYDSGELDVKEGDRADFLMFESEGKDGRRGRGAFQEIVYDPPKERRVVYKGNLVRLHP